MFLCDGNFTSRGESKGLSYWFNWFLSLSGRTGIKLTAGAKVARKVVGRAYLQQVVARESL